MTTLAVTALAVAPRHVWTSCDACAGHALAPARPPPSVLVCPLCRVGRPDATASMIGFSSGSPGDPAPQ